MMPGKFGHKMIHKPCPKKCDNGKILVIKDSVGRMSECEACEGRGEIIEMVYVRPPAPKYHKDPDETWWNGTATAPDSPIYRMQDYYMDPDGRLYSDPPWTYGDTGRTDSTAGDSYFGAGQ